MWASDTIKNAFLATVALDPTGGSYSLMLLGCFKA